MQQSSVEQPPAFEQYLFHMQSTPIKGSISDRVHTGIPDKWILLDSQSTVCMFKNSIFLQDIRRSKARLRVESNGGCQYSDHVGELPNFGTVWYNPASLANILSLSAVSKLYRVSTLDTAVENALCVHKSNGDIMKFVEFENGLYYHDASTSSDKHTTNCSVTGYSFLSTVSSNKKLFTRREIALADEARALNRRIGRPSQAFFEQLLQNHFIRNCPLTVDDAKRAVLIYGPDIAALKGKTTKNHMIQEHVPDFAAVSIPSSVLEHHRTVTLCVDNFYVNGNVFMHTISRNLQFRTATSVPNRYKSTLLPELNKVLAVYEARGFEVQEDIHTDREFECMREDLRPINMDVVDPDTHVPEVERSIRTVKERVRATIQGLPFKRIPRAMVRGVVSHALQSLNQFPAQNGVSQDTSPHTIMTGHAPPDYNLMPLEFGTYAQVFEDNDPTNTNKTRSTGAIVMDRAGNAGGGYNFMSLITGAKLSRRQWTALPMPDGVIARVEELARTQGQPSMIDGKPIFEWQPGAPVDGDGDGPNLDEDGDAGYQVLQNHPPWGNGNEIERHLAEEDAVEGPGAEQENDVLLDAFEPDPDDDGEGPPDLLQRVSDDEYDSDNDDSSVESDYEAPGQNQERDEPYDERNPDGEAAANGEAPTVETVIDEGSILDNEPVEARYNLRTGNRGASYGHRLDHQMDEPENEQSYKGMQFLQRAVEEMIETDEISHESQQFIMGFIMTQMNATKGIKKHGQRAVEALYKEFLQLNERNVFEGLNESSLTKKQKKEALRAINLIKEKRNGVLKGRTVADGSAQRGLYTKEETASPTVSNDALMASLIIDAKEERDVACADVAGAYLNADMDELVILKLTGEAVKIMCSVNPEFKRYVCQENGRNTLYLRLRKALYGCIRSALLWYRLFSETLQGLGFELNPYDPCVANKMVNGKQCTIVWYVDDNKISHVESEVVTDVIEKIEERFGKMVVSRGNKHVFLGMEIHFPGDKTVKIRMRDHIGEAIEDFGEDIGHDVTSPAKKTLFEVSLDSRDLSEKKRDTFHSIVAKLLYVSKRSRPDVQLPVVFLCTRVSRSTEEDWGKLKRVLAFLKGTIDDWHHLGADDLSVMMTWVDASYAVHQDMKSHTGGGISMGRGTLMSKSTKQKLNTKSSTEAELVGASDYLPNTIWMRNFLLAQGYEIKSNVFYQDNQSAMKLEINGRSSAGPNSRHIDIRYFFFKDRIGSENLSVTYCPTESMLADFFTKPLQGGLFKKLRAVVMGHMPTSSLLLVADAEPEPNQERVGNSDATEGTTKENGRTDDSGRADSQGKENCVRTYLEAARLGVKAECEKRNETERNKKVSFC